MKTTISYVHQHHTYTHLHTIHRHGRTYVQSVLDHFDYMTTTSTLCCIAWHYFALHCITLNYMTLHKHTNIQAYMDTGIQACICMNIHVRILEYAIVSCIFLDAFSMLSVKVFESFGRCFQGRIERLRVMVPRKSSGFCCPSGRP